MKFPYTVFHLRDHPAFSEGWAAKIRNRGYLNPYRTSDEYTWWSAFGAGYDTASWFSWGE